MEKRHLFDNNHRYNETAMFLDKEIHYSLARVMNEYVKQGYSPREIAHIMMLAVMALECETIL